MTIKTAFLFSLWLLVTPSIGIAQATTTAEREQASRNTWDIEEARERTSVLTTGLALSVLMQFLMVAGGWYAIKRGRREDADERKKEVFKWINEHHNDHEFEKHMERETEKIADRRISEEFRLRGPTFTDTKVTDGLEKRVEMLERMQAVAVSQGTEINKALGSVQGQLQTLISMMGKRE